MDTLIDFLKKRYTQAEKFTKQNFLDQAKKAIEDYDANDDLGSIDVNNKTEAVKRRYEFIVPLIFTNVESVKANAFERIPTVMFNARGNDDQEKKQKVDAAYKYITDITDLEAFMFDTFHWFSLLGWCSGHTSFKNESKKVPVLDEQGDEMIEPSTGETLMREVYTYNDPILEAGDPLKEVYSPDSEFDVNANKVPYRFRKKSVTPGEIKRTYGVEVEPDSKMDYVKDEDSEKNKDNNRVMMYFYYGDVNEDVSKDVKVDKDDKKTKTPYFPDWEEDKQYYIIYAGDKILYVGDESNNCKIGKWYGNPNKFFGYGMGKIGRQFQKEKSIRRGQQIRLADIAAFPKMIYENNGTTKIDLNAMLDPRENLVVQYQGTKPEYLQPGNLAPVVTANAERADSDAQQAFGMLDISTGAQKSSTVDTATGQSLFADASQKRTAFAKKKYLKFIRAIIIDLLMKARDNWDEEKLVTITDEDGTETDVNVSAQDLTDVDFEKDLVIDFENASANKDILRQQSIAFYDKTKDDSLVNRRAVIKDLVKNGFDRQNFKEYIKESTVAPGTVLMDEQGQRFVVSDSGDLVDEATMNQMGTPSNETAIKTQPNL